MIGGLIRIFLLLRIQRLRLRLSLPLPLLLQKLMAMAITLLGRLRVRRSRAFRSHGFYDPWRKGKTAGWVWLEGF